ncbi:hypothetical protein LINGRAHAP2_LOCUS4589, partial [Linum grandiflorum]
RLEEEVNVGADFLDEENELVLLEILRRRSKPRRKRNRRGRERNLGRREWRRSYDSIDGIDRETKRVWQRLSAERFEAGFDAERGLRVDGGHFGRFWVQGSSFHDVWRVTEASPESGIPRRSLAGGEGSRRRIRETGL